MSDPRPRFTAAARRDIRAILQYTATTWDDDQAIAYAKLLEEACTKLAIYPLLGRPRPEIAPELRAFPVESHVILYRPRKDGVIVLRVVHRRMDLANVSLL